MENVFRVALKKLRWFVLLFAAALSAPVTAVDQNVGIWVNAAELSKLPMAGGAWSSILLDATANCGIPDLFDQEDDTDQCILAKAIVSTRLFQESPTDPVAQGMRDDVLTGLAAMMDEGNWCPNFACPTICNGLPNTCPRTTLALGRNLGAYIASADLIGLDENDTPSRTDLVAFLNGTGDSSDPPEIAEGVLNYQWIDEGTPVQIQVRRRLHETLEERPNNWGGQACVSLAAAAIFLEADADLQAIYDLSVGWLGDCENGDCTSFVYDEDAADWTCDQQPPSHGINEKDNCLINISQTGGNTYMNLEGVQVDDMRRAGVFPAGCDEFPRACVADSHIWEGLQGRITCAHILRRQGLDLWDLSDRALLRAVQFQHRSIWRIGGVPGVPNPPHLNDEGNPNDDAYLAYIYNYAYNEDLPLDPIPGQREFGKSFGWTRYTIGEHPCGSIDEDPDFDGVCGVPEPDTVTTLLSGAALLSALHRRRLRRIV